MRSALAALWGGGAGALSAPPAIYGVVAEAEVRRLRPLFQGGQGEAAALELAAAEMAQAAARLVEAERRCAAARPRDAAAVAATQAIRTEAAAQLERRMAAMEAVLAARRTVAVAAPPEALELEAFGTLAPMEGLGAGGRLGVSSSGPAAGNGYEILLQGFNWESHKGGQYYKRMLDAVEGLAEAGVTTVWLPPPSDAVSPQGYLPRDLYRLDSAYGSEGELRELIAALKRRGVKAVADVVINHRCAHSQDSAGRWNVFGGRLPWDASAVCCNNPAFGGTGAHKTGEDYAAAPNVDHTQPRVRQDLVRWLTWMRQSIGFDGWRFDFVKVQRVKRGEAGACGRGGGGAFSGWGGGARHAAPPAPSGHAGQSHMLIITPTPPRRATRATLCGNTSTRLCLRWPWANTGTRAVTPTACWTTTRRGEGDQVWVETGGGGRAGRGVPARTRVCPTPALPTPSPSFPVQDAHRQRTINWCDRTGGTAAAFDFTTKGILQEALARGELWRLVDVRGRPPGVVGLWPSRAVLFLENHDTGSTLGHWPFPNNHLPAG